MQAINHPMQLEVEITRSFQMSRVLVLYNLLVLALLTLSGCSDGSDNSYSQADLTQLTAMEAVKAMKAGEFTPSEYAEVLLARAEELDHLNAFIYLNPEEVREAAKEATEKLKSGESVGALIGLPLAVKDSVDTAGIPTTGGTSALVSNVPEENAPFLQALLDEGAYVFGKTNLAEMSYDPLGRNDFYGIVLNPYDITRTPGGTSSGTGVAVSARIVPLGVGEDSAGSIRIPSAWTGVVGFSPTSGRYSNAGIVPLAPHRDTPGPMARTIDDVILVDGLVTGSPLDLPPANLQGLRIGLMPSYWNIIDPSSDEVFQRVLARLEELGVVFVRENVPDLNQIVAANFLTDMLCSGFDAINDYLLEHELGFDFYYVRDNVVTPAVAGVMVLATPGVISEENCERSLSETRPEVQQLYAQYFDQHNVDALVLPTVIFPAPPIGEQTVIIDGEPYEALNWGIRNVEPAAFAGLPSLSIPVGLTETEQLPVGLLIDGPAGEDRRVLAIGKAFERALPGTPPPELD
jgi:mandelamide amidase